MDDQRYIDEVLAIALKCDNKMLGNNWTYQQDGARWYTHHLSQKCYADHFPAFIPNDRWPPNSPDLCSFDHSLSNELGEAMNWKHVRTKSTLKENNKMFL